ncbi:MAG: DUF3276 family protein [Ferruginibacter sp.]|nr:DUF3276 family protein [Bacteroidota bacterium]MBX2920531.1 DUF3276 family protein [Ferruginibacter sp.]MCB0708454.1 DUF3276 family protein [Chitinophagaceae bacterium]
MAYENNEKKMESVYSKRIRAGKRRTYFFDVRETRGNDYYLTITESRKRFDSDGYDRHKIFLYKEDFNKFIKGLGEAVDFVKTDLMPDFDFDAFNHENAYEGDEGLQNNTDTPAEAAPKVVAETNTTEQTSTTEKVASNANETATDNATGNGSDEVAEKW